MSAGHTTLALVLFQLESLVVAAHSESDVNSGAVFDQMNPVFSLWSLLLLRRPKGNAILTQNG